ncbi:MAG: hypothetical protein LHW46_09050 [Candidatus Cloacimonetes bacterium]|nr:hypothetical protein [Candidatus Cloacimonadota bacterium]
MYTLTVKIAKGGTTYINDEGISHPSAFGHMWYSLAGDGVQTESFGFAPKEENIYPPMGPGYVTQYDNQGYQWTYYTGQIVIDSNQYQKLLDFGINPVDVGGFNLYYRGLENSCIDFTWKALYLAGFNPSNFEGNIFPHSNADDADAALYKYLMGNLDGWDSSQPNAGDYHVIYGSNGGDVLIAELQTDAIYGGGGNDTLVGSVLNDFLVGGEGSDQLYGGGSYDTYIAGMGDTISDDDGSGEVYFEGLLLTGGTQEAGQSCESDGEGKIVYKGNGGTYTLSNGVLQFTDSSANHVRIEGFKNGHLGINLEGHPADDEECEEDKCPQPITPTNNISIPLPSQSIGGGGSDGGSGGGGSSVDTPLFACVYTPELNSAGIGGGGSSTGPIVLDLNRNGITSISLATSQALFDYDGNGVKESSAWSESSDALLVNDINQDGLWHVAQNNTYFKIKREVA